MINQPPCNFVHHRPLDLVFLTEKPKAFLLPGPVLLSHVGQLSGSVAVQAHTRNGLYNDNQKLRGFSPQANYTDRATATCRRS
jgi:hypothetical protein